MGYAVLCHVSESSLPHAARASIPSCCFWSETVCDVAQEVTALLVESDDAIGEEAPIQVEENLPCPECGQKGGCAHIH